MRRPRVFRPALTAGIICIGIFLFLASAEAAGPVFSIAKYATDRGKPTDKALSIGATAGSVGHLLTVRGIIGAMTPCQKLSVPGTREYVAALRQPTRRIIYSFSHGACEASSTPDTSQHIFLGLGLCAWDDFAGVDSAHFVGYQDIPNNHPYALVFVNACHSGDEAVGYSGASGSTSTSFRDAFNSTVYIAARGGNHGMPILESCSKCLDAGTAAVFAVNFFTEIRNRRDANDNVTFCTIKVQFDREDQPNAANSKYIIYGGTTHILTVFPH